MHLGSFALQAHHARWVFIALTVVLAVLASAAPLLAAPPAQAPIVVDAIDNDPANKLWNCETNRVPFDNQETDRSRCFTFRYTVPPEGISSATVHIALDTLGSLQDTDATIVAVAEPMENCAWGIGSTSGCVVLHGGFQGGEKSLNLNLLDIACDTSIPNPPEAQQLVVDALNTGVLHMELQDDTAVYSAQLVLNGGDPAFTCGTSVDEVSTYVPTPGPAAAATNAAIQSAFNALNQIFDPPEYVVHAIERATPNGAVAEELYFLFPDAPDDAGLLNVPDGAGGTINYTTDYWSGPFTSPREVCEGAGMRVGDTPLQSWNGGDAFQCSAGSPVPAQISTTTTTPQETNPVAAFLNSPALNELLTGTAEPPPPNRDGATTAVVAGAIALGIFAAANYLISSGGFVKSATANATRAHGKTAPTMTDSATPRKGAAGVDTASYVRASDQTVPDTPPSRGVETDGISAVTRAGVVGVEAAASAGSELRGNSGVGVGAKGTGAEGDWSAAALKKAAEEGISSIPDAKDVVQDQLMGQVEKRDKRERLLAEQARLNQVIKTREQQVAAARLAVETKQAAGGNFSAEQREWDKAKAELAQVNDLWIAVVNELAALDEKKGDEK